MRTMHGVIMVVQESRFRLARENGGAWWFVLAHGAPMEPQDLPAFQRAGVPVTVHYEDAERLLAGVAHDIVPDGHRERDGRGR